MAKKETVASKLAKQIDKMHPEPAYVETGIYKPYKEPTVQALKRMGYEVDKRMQGVYLISRPKKTISLQTLKRMIFTNSKDLDKVIIGGRVHEWHGIGMVDCGPATKLDKESYPTVMERGEGEI